MNVGEPFTKMSVMQMEFIQTTFTGVHHLYNDSPNETRLRILHAIQDLSERRSFDDSLVERVSINNELPIASVKSLADDIFGANKSPSDRANLLAWVNKELHKVHDRLNPPAHRMSYKAEDALNSVTTALPSFEAYLRPNVLLAASHLVVNQINRNNKVYEVHQHLDKILTDILGADVPDLPKIQRVLGQFEGAIKEIPNNSDLTALQLEIANQLEALLKSGPPPI